MGCNFRPLSGVDIPFDGHSLQWATPVALSVDPGQTGCLFLPYNQQYVFNITFSNSPLDGLQVCVGMILTCAFLWIRRGKTVFCACLNPMTVCADNLQRDKH